MVKLRIIHVVAAVMRSENEKPVIFATQRGYGEQKGGWEFPGGKIEPGETAQEALVREIREELDTEIRVGEKISTIKYDYPAFHLSMDVFWCELLSDHMELKEHEAAKWLTKETLRSVEWLPADITLIDEIEEALSEEEPFYLTEEEQEAMLRKFRESDKHMDEIWDKV